MLHEGTNEQATTNEQAERARRMTMTQRQTRITLATVAVLVYAGVFWLPVLGGSWEWVGIMHAIVLVAITLAAALRHLLDAAWPP